MSPRPRGSLAPDSPNRATSRLKPGERLPYRSSVLARWLMCWVLLLVLAALPEPGKALTVNPGPVVQDALFAEGKRHFDSGDLDAAQAVWSNVFQRTPYGPVAYCLLARGRVAAGEPDKAEAMLKEFLLRHPASPYRDMAKEALADIYCRQVKPEGKIVLNAILARAGEKDKAGLILQLAELERRIGSYPEAAAHYRELFLKYPASVEGLKASEDIAWMVFHGKIPRMLFTEREQLDRAAGLHAKGRFDLAVEAYQAVLKLRPTDKGLMVQTARCLFKDRKDQRAIAVLKDVLKGEVAEKDRMEALHLLSLIYWRLDRGKDFELCCNAVMDKGPPVLKRKAIYNMASYHLENGRFDEALSFLNKLQKVNSDPALSSQARWKAAWIQYSSRRYPEAAEAFREMRSLGAGGDLVQASKYWQARSLMAAKRTNQSQELLKEVVESAPLHYYGIEASRLLKSLGIPGEPAKKAAPSFPNVKLTAADQANGTVNFAEKLMELGLHEFALMNLSALPKAVRSSPSIAFLTARAAYGAQRYKVAHDALSSAFGPFLENPPADAPPEFVEMAFPRVHFSETMRLAQKHDIDPHLIWAVIRQESRYDAEAVSPAGALGLMQVTPGAAGVPSRRGKVSPAVIAEVLEPKRNIELGIRILAKNLQTFQGKLVPAVASYNADIRKVRTWLQRNGKLKQDEFIENIPFRETRLYVKKVLAGYRAYAVVHRKKDMAGLW
jgi:soluble lytic murein transglycosylase